MTSSSSTPSSSPSTTTLLDQELIYHIGANSQLVSFEWTRHTGTGESQTTTSSTYYYHYDVHGNTLKVTDTNQDTKITYTYDTLGNITSQTNPDSIPNPFTFMGASQTILDTETNLYFSSGYYNPQTGTLLQGTGSPAMPNPTSISTINSMSTSSLPEAQLLSHSITSATTAGSSSGGEPGSFAPPPGPSDGIANAGKRGVPDPTATISLSTDMPMYSDAFVGGVSLKPIGGDTIQPTPPGDRIQPTPPKFDPPPTTDDPWEQFVKDEVEFWRIGRLHNEYKDYDLFLLAHLVHTAGLSDSEIRDIDWAVLFEYKDERGNTRYHFVGYQVKGKSPHLYWGPYPVHTEEQTGGKDHIYPGKEFIGEVAHDHNGNEILLPGRCLFDSYRRQLTPVSWEADSSGKLCANVYSGSFKIINNVGKPIEIVLQGGFEPGASTGSIAYNFSMLIPVDNSGKVFMGWYQGITKKDYPHDTSGIVIVAYHNSDGSVSGSVWGGLDSNGFYLKETFNNICAPEGDTALKRFLFTNLLFMYPENGNRHKCWP